MKERKLRKKNSIQKRLIIEFIITVILVFILSAIGFYIFVHKEVEEMLRIQGVERERLNYLFWLAITIILVNTIIISSMIIKLASKKILEPLKKMIEATKKVADGNFEVRLETQRKDEIQDLVTNFNQMVEELGKTELLQKDFIDNVSHEIKTPINSIEGFAKLLEEDNLSKAEKKEYIGIILEESDRLLKLSTSILKLSKLQHQEKIVKKETIDISEQIRKAVAVLEPKWRKKNIEISVDLMNCYFQGDGDLLFQVWTNLIDNAIKFSNENGKISLKTQKNKNEIIIQIKDNGIGMEEAEIERIYTKFYQVDKSHSQEGSGLRISYRKKNHRIV